MTYRTLTKSTVAAFVLLFALSGCNNQPKQQTVQDDALQAQKEQQYQDSLKLAEQAEREAAEREAAEQERIKKEQEELAKQEELKSIPIWLNGAFSRSYVTMPDRLEDVEQITEVYDFDRENRTCRLVVYKNNGNNVNRGEAIKFTVNDDVIYIDGTPTLRIYESDFIEPYLAAYNNYQKKYGKVN